MLTQTGESLALFQNMGDPEYVRIVFGPDDIASVFGRHRKPFLKNGMTRTGMISIVDRGTEMLMKDSLPNTPYSEETMEQLYSTRNKSSGI